MTRTARHRGAVAALVLALVAVAAWWIDARTRPERVGPRFVAALLVRHPGTTVQLLDGGLLHAGLPSGVYVDVRMPVVFGACRASRFGCSDAIDAALAAVDRSEAATHAPQTERLRPIVVGEPGGYRYGYITDPLVGPYEIRYALVDGAASTFATGTIVDRLALSRDALRAAALAGLRTERDAGLERIDEGATPLYRVRADGDPAASLLDRERMARFATQVGSSKLYATIPLRGTLLLAAASDASASALELATTRLRGRDARTLDGGVLAYDVDAPDGHALSIATLSTALRRP